MTFHPGLITKPLLADAVHDHLLKSVIRGDLAPRQRLQVDQLAASFGVSRTPVREAITRLAAAGLVQSARNSSPVVADWGLADMQIRARMLGGIAHAALLAMPARLAVTPGDSFVSICSRLVTGLGYCVSTQITNELVAPLRLFCEPDLLALWGIPTPISLERELQQLSNAIDSGVTTDAVAAMDSLTEAFVGSLLPHDVVSSS